MKHYAFEEFAPEFLSFFQTVYPKLFDEWKRSRRRKGNTPMFELFDEDENLIEDEYWWKDLFFLALRSDREDLVTYLERYLSDAEAYYNCCEEPDSFGSCSWQVLLDFFSGSLYLCWKYYESIGDKANAETAYFFLLCRESGEPFNEKMLPYIEDHFEVARDCIYNDWLAVNPRVTWSIGKYYLDKKDYDRAREFFDLGATLDYHERQSPEPFVEVGKNKYELGLMYLYGLGVEKDGRVALEYFESAASDVGAESLPIIGDMYYEGLGVDRDLDAAINAYGCYNADDLNEEVYYREMSDLQKERLRELLARSDRG